ncbi:MAG TPA: hypothetical protein VM734_31020 [Kofleriaceae bacterium]|nr:hypothetical protein [Kofleriaceae bacterium]
MAQPRKILTVLLLSATPALASPDGAAAPRRPPPDEQAPRALIALRSELFETGQTRARLQMSRFRPLCDAEGFPLVGNVASKGNLYQPSQFCADVRKAGKS